MHDFKITEEVTAVLVADVSMYFVDSSWDGISDPEGCVACYHIDTLWEFKFDREPWVDANGDGLRCVEGTTALVYGERTVFLTEEFWRWVEEL